MIERHKTRAVKVGEITVGGDAPVSVQSMTNTATADADATLAQIKAMRKLGCDIVRCAVPDMTAAEAMKDICAGSPAPVIADIHFDHRLALAAISAGAAAVRLNPGNLAGGEKAVREVAEAAGAAGIAIRVGANSGSVRPQLVRKFMENGMPHDEAMAEALVTSAAEQCAMLEKYGFRSIKAALKSSSVPVTVEAYRKFAARTDYPLHIGVTEAGTPARGIIKSAAGIGALLLQGIGDTLRVSLTADPLNEVTAGIRILESCGIREAAPQIVSCPTCGRTAIDLIGLAEKTEALVAEIKAAGKKIKLRKIAVMGCAVNGPGEAKDADLGIAGGKKGMVVIFRRGEILGAMPYGSGFEFFRKKIEEACE